MRCRTNSIQSRAEGSTTRLSARSLKQLQEERSEHLAALKEIDTALQLFSSGGDSWNRTKALDPRFPSVDYNYGYTSKSSGVYVDTASYDGQGGPPGNLLLLGVKNFREQFIGMIDQISGKPGGPHDGNSKQIDALVDPESFLIDSFDMSPEGQILGARSFDPGASMRREGLAKLKLSNRAVREREEAREALPGGAVKSPILLKIPYLALCGFIDLTFENRPIQRFWFLETVRPSLPLCSVPR